MDKVESECVIIHKGKEIPVRQKIFMTPQKAHQQIKLFVENPLHAWRDGNLKN